MSAENGDKLKNFDVLVDSSGLDSNGTGMLEKILNQINSSIPKDIPSPQAGIHTFAPEATKLEFATYTPELFQQGIQNLIRGFSNGEKSSLGNGLNHFAPFYSAMQRQGAVIVMTDGEYSSGRDSLNETKIFYLTQPGLCLHFISFADSPEGQKLIDSMAGISKCSVSARAADLLDNSGLTADFVRRALLIPGTAVALADAANAGKEELVIDSLMLTMPFAFNSASLDPRTIKIVDALADKLRRQPEISLKIDGFTCDIGTESYNLDLSRRRAEAVKNYLVNAGITPNRLITEGHGEANPFYDNKTPEGRFLNRRAEFTFLESGNP
jgi:OOP family OmpA-OmpF porin